MTVNVQPTPWPSYIHQDSDDSDVIDITPHWGSLAGCREETRPSRWICWALWKPNRMHGSQGKMHASRHSNLMIIIMAYCLNPFDLGIWCLTQPKPIPSTRYHGHPEFHGPTERTSCEHGGTWSIEKCSRFQCTTASDPRDSVWWEVHGSFQFPHEQLRDQIGPPEEWMGVQKALNGKGCCEQMDGCKGPESLNNT